MTDTCPDVARYRSDNGEVTYEAFVTKEGKTYRLCPVSEDGALLKRFEFGHEAKSLIFGHPWEILDAITEGRIGWAVGDGHFGLSHE